MGCPDKSVFHKGAGAALIINPSVAKKIILAVKKGIKDGKEKYEIDRHITASVKTRTGYREPQTKEWISHLLEVEPDVICIHARTFAQKYSGLADWSQIKIASDLSKNSKTKIFGNGDIKSRVDALKKIKEYDLAGVLIGRGALGNPWIFQGKVPTTKERFEVIIEHCKKFIEFFPTANLSIMRKHLGWYAKDFPHASEVRNELMQVNSIDDVKKILFKTQAIL
jgi:tRNA-dihydrouridine synthase B